MRFSLIACQLLMPQMPEKPPMERESVEGLSNLSSAPLEVLGLIKL
ncbi:hypothetical protein SAMN04488056_104149 [Cohaesibacter marisflavi]|uniref:Uncharacterized protein n=1 Tax=Cohaesibacter marisflavi TaxID=655353 RepID=A0A1I5FPN2_9HYPH|nr:hypothetical protein SAMN04488056_104149 [Cohaesibacter marisflavi]